MRNHQSPTSSVSKTRKKCQSNEEADNVVLIDVDSDHPNNVILIDVPESLRKKLRGSSVLRKDKNCQFRTIIYIDDDDDDASSDNNQHGMGVEGGGDFYDDTFIRERFRSASETRNSEDDLDDECQFVQENFPPLNLSKSKRAYPGKSYGRNRYGFGPESDTSSSDDNCPDCEFMEDSLGKLREQWEKANKKRKYDVSNGQSGRHGQATTSGLRADVQQNVESENLADRPTKAGVFPSSGDARYENLSPSDQSGEGTSQSAYNNPKSPCSEFGSKLFGEGKTCKHFEHDGSSLLDEEGHCFGGPSLSSSHDQGNNQVNHTKRFSPGKDKNLPPETRMSDPDLTFGINIDPTEASLPDEYTSFFRTQHSVETEFYHDKEMLQKTPSCNFRCPNESDGTTGSSVDKVEAASGEPSFQNSKLSHGMQVNHIVGDIEVGANYIVKPVTKEPSFSSGPHNDVNAEWNMESKLMCNLLQQEEKDDLVHLQVLDVNNAIEGSIINDREKLKETDEYKRAVEEEWASRQRELKLQAEEAQRLRRLRKRKKAESMRLLEMERRQKQRVEEMREFQKKDEENMNLKEQLRAEVRKELYKLELNCPDMASLLRGLGIEVGGGFQPLPHEVRAAYKRALLSFHPDRASGSDIRQLVEAEEKFKLISRMKDKLLKTR